MSSGNKNSNKSRNGCKTLIVKKLNDGKSGRKFAENIKLTSLVQYVIKTKHKSTRSVLVAP